MPDLDPAGVEAAALSLYALRSSTGSSMEPSSLDMARAAITAYLRAVPESDELARLRAKLARALDERLIVDDHEVCDQQLRAVTVERDRYERALRDIAYDDGGVCTYGGHDDARNMMDPECPGAVCWAKRALTPPVTELALSPDEVAGDE